MKQILLIISLFLGLFITDSFSQKGVLIDQIIGVVGSKAILESDVEAQYIQYQARGHQSQGDPKCEIFEKLLFEKLLINQAKIDSVEVSKKQVEGEIDRRINIFIEQIGGIEKLEVYFNKSLAEIKESFREMVRNQIITQKMQMEITSNVRISPKEVDQFFDNFPKDSLPIIDAEYEIQQITKYPLISKDENEEVKKRISKFRERIINGEKFSTIAILYSEDKLSAKKGGELGFIGRSELVPEFAAVAFSLKKDEVSEIVKTDFGYHIIKMIEKKGSKVNVRHILLSPRISATTKIKAKSLLDSIAKIVREKKMNFGQAAMEFSEDKDTKKNMGLLVNPYTGTSKFESKHIDPTTFFKLKRMKVNEISEPFEAKDLNGKAVIKIIVMKSKTEAHSISLKNDYKKIQDMALNSKKQDVVNKWVKQKQKETYIKINKTFKKCNFNFKGWTK